MDGKAPAKTLLQSEDNQAEKTGLNLQGKQVPKRTNSWKEFAGRTSGSAGYQIGDWKQGKKREQQQAQLRKQTLEHAHQQDDQPGTYIVKTKAILGQGPEVASEDIQWVAEGSALHVLEVVEDVAAKRVRGRVEEPAGWISLRDTDSGARWAVRQGGLTSLSSPASPAAELTAPSDAASPAQAVSESATATSPSAVRELTFEQKSPASTKDSAAASELATPPLQAAAVPELAATPQHAAATEAPAPAQTLRQVAVTKAPQQKPLWMLLKKPLWPQHMIKPRTEDSSQHPELRAFGAILAVAALGLRIGLLARRGRSTALSKFVVIALLAAAMGFGPAGHDPAGAEFLAALMQQAPNKKLALKH